MVVPRTHRGRGVADCLVVEPRRACRVVQQVGEVGAVLRERRVLTSRDVLCKAFADCGSVRIILEASTESEWVAAALEAAGHEVIVADPNYAPM